LYPEGDVLRGEGRVGRPQEELAVEARLDGDRRPVDAQQARGGGAQEAPVGELCPQAAGELRAFSR